MRARACLALPSVALVLWFAGCGDVVAQPIGDGPGQDGGSDSPFASDGFPPGDGDSVGDGASFCTGTGPIQLPGSDECTGDLAHLFRFAACACTSLAVSGLLLTDSFDSTSDAGPAGQNAASIAGDTTTTINAMTTVGGSVWAGGQGVTPGMPAVTLLGSGTIARDVQSGGDLQVGGIYQVAGDVYAEGNVDIPSGGSLSVLGAVYVPVGDTATGVTTGGGVQTGAVQVPQPCDCSSPVDIASIVSARQNSNDDAALPLSVSAFDQPSPTVQLPCGQYWVDGMSGSGTVTLDVLGRVVLFVGGDVSIEQLTIQLGTPEAELDLFVDGSVQILGSTSIGDKNAPARVRMYVSGTSFTLSADASIGANVYAPNAVVALASSFEMWGSIFAQQLQFSGDFTIHYDTSVLQQPGCTPPGTPCTTCDNCSGATPACKDGTCVPCVTSADCCAPLACSSGACVLEAQ